ncbi:hypothetical protein AOQ84DRAFT_387053 [Glonium stellatum]|uniref:Zn(2)-C6 fungal-type domain-containing protein n=1 Tax=Glonium stellatum TaxID=574774 RepID=A0A8E2F6P4_9PEZI|nr:hypothetical protein AOQ84DRAFT_387053 [Glonium stellatum]
MVGVPRSKGCLTCVKQRVKCDETKPACVRCTRFGRECPGYEKLAKFVYEVPREGEGQGSFLHVRELSRPNPRTGRRRNIENSPEVSENKQTSASTGSLGIPSAIVPPTQQDIQSLSVFMKNSSIQDAYTEIQWMRKWLSFIPSRLGTSKVLDDAVHCLVSHHVGRLSGQDQVVRRARLAYGQALLSLQQAISDPEQGVSSNTLCATLVLSLYELFSCTKKDAWVKHSGGASRLMQIRGSARHMNEFDRVMLYAFRGQMVMEAFMQRSSCFLDSEDWKIVLSDPASSFSSIVLNLSNEFYAYLAACPGMAKGIINLQRDNLNEVVSFFSRMNELINNLSDWFRRFRDVLPPPEEVPSSTNDPTFPIVYRYDCYCNFFHTVYYYGCMILLKNFLRSTQFDPNLEAENIFMVSEVCKTVEGASYFGIFGPYGAVFGLRMAFMVADLPTKMWIKNQLDKMSEAMPIMRYQVSMGADVVLAEEE